jgi:Predicted integral membrane protein
MNIDIFTILLYNINRNFHCLKRCSDINIEKKKKITILLCILLSLNILFIWSNSLLNSDESNSRSNFVVEILRKIKHAAEDFFENNDSNNSNATSNVNNSKSESAGNVTKEITINENSDTSLQKKSTPEKTSKPPLINSKNISTIVRKMAHFMEFMLLGMVLWIMNIYLKKPNLITIIFICQSVAIADEFIQSFSGRTDKVSDIIIDICGAATGIVFTFVIYKIIESVKSKKLKVEK